MRRLIGGELALTDLLLKPTCKALQTIALWVGEEYGFKTSRAINDGLKGTCRGQNTILLLLAQHESQPVYVQQLIELIRANTDPAIKCILLVSTAPLSKEAALWLENSHLPLTLIGRDELIRLAGFHCPATDEQLSQLGRQNKIRRSGREWLHTVLAPSRARRYLGYGIGLCVLSLLTGQRYYPIPAAVCFLLYAACKIRHAVSDFRAGV